MNPFLTEEGSKQIFSQKLETHFPWLAHYDLPEDATDAAIFKTYAGALDKIENAQGKSGNLLDIGCGSGHFLQMAKKRGWNVEGLDFTSANVAKIKAKLGITIHEGTLKQAGLKPQSYDAMTMWDYFEHVENPKEILNLAYSLLKPGGILVIACPNHKSLLFFAAFWLNRLTFGKNRGPLRMLYPPTHLSYFEPSFLSYQAGKEEFRTFSTEYDETDLKRVEIQPFLKPLLSVFFKLAKKFSLSNRFTLFLERPVIR